MREGEKGKGKGVNGNSAAEGSRLRKIGHRCIRKRPGTVPGQTVFYVVHCGRVGNLDCNVWLVKMGTHFVMFPKGHKVSLLMWSIFPGQTVADI